MELGYGDTTIDEIVKRAGGSKATIYKHFKNKEELFSTVVDELVRHRPTGELNPDEPPRKALLDYAESRLKVVFTKEHIALRRLVIGEGSRFPKIAKLYYDHGPGLSRKQLEDYFKEEKKTRHLEDQSSENRRHALSRCPDARHVFAHLVCSKRPANTKADQGSC